MRRASVAARPLRNSCFVLLKLRDIPGRQKYRSSENEKSGRASADFITERPNRRRLREPCHYKIVKKITTLYVVERRARLSSFGSARLYIILLWVCVGGAVKPRYNTVSMMGSL